MLCYLRSQSNPKKTDLPLWHEFICCWTGFALELKPRGLMLLEECASSVIYKRHFA